MLINATRVTHIWPYGTLFTWWTESHVIAGFGMGYPTRHLIIQTGATR